MTITAPETNRAPAGTRTGGQFTIRERRESDTVLVEAWVGGEGEPHPEGGYDDAKIDVLSNNIYFTRNGELFRLDGPAVMLGDGTQEYYEKPGLLHREGGEPAVITSDGTQEWRKDGLLHREGDLPALVDYDGKEGYYFEGKPHRQNGPAITFPSGRKEYWYHGTRIRVDEGDEVETSGARSTIHLNAMQKIASASR